MCSLQSFVRDDHGATPALEFVLVFPIVMIVIAVIVQTALLLVAQAVVEQAAFQAARSAIVWVPARLAGEAPGHVRGSESKKLDHVQQAAALACASIVPASVFGAPRGGAPTARVHLGAASLVARAAHARSLTRARLDRSRYAERSAISATVEHDYILRVPGAALLLGRPLGFSLRVRTLRARATLTNQGGVPDVVRA
jgi:hypothetical protein